MRTPILRQGSLRFLLRLSCVFLCLVFTGFAQAYTFTVSSLSNSGNGTLRQALSYVNNGDSVIFSVTGTINITTELTCTKSIQLIGPGASSLTIDAGNNSRVFNLDAVGAMYIEGITIKDGHLISSSQLEGGGIYATVDSLYLTGIVLTSNNIGTTSSGGSTNIKGGGAYIESELLVLDSVMVTGNTSRGRPLAYGGGLYVVSDVVRMYNSNIYSNGVYTDQYVGGSTASAGGAYIDADSIYFDHCNIYSNTARAESGWQTYNSGTTRGGGLYTTNTSSTHNALIFQNVKIYSNNSNSVGNYSYPYGGGWYGEDHDITVDSLDMYNNRIYMYDWHDGTGRGYAMYLNGVSSYEMTNSKIYNHAYNRTGYDHHVVYINATGDISIEYLKAYNNDIQANYSQSIFYLSGENGEIKNAEFYNNNTFSTGTMRMLVTDFTYALDIYQSSFYNNDRTIEVQGGDLSLTNSTLTENTEDIYTTDTTITITLVNSTVDGIITAPDMEFENTILFDPDLSGTITTNGGNIINSPNYSSSFTLNSDNNNVNPVLDTFDYHGGYTKVYSLLSFSQAINNGVSNGITTDQRGYTRNGNVDIGAFEFNGTPYDPCANITATDVVHTCQSSYTWIDGNTYTSNNTTATDTLTTAGGCDSIVTLNLTLHSPSYTTQYVQACSSYTWIDGNTYTSNNTTATDTLQDQYGCDSIITLNLNLSLGYQHTVSVQACSSYTWIDGNTYTTSNNTASVTMTSSNGCDSIVNLNLTILNATTGVDVVSACESYTWIDGNTYTASNNTATHTLVNSAGCDSTVTLNLTMLSATSATQSITACNSHTWIDGNTYTSSNNTATHTITNAQGCDSVISLNLTINNTINQSQFITACESYTWIDGNVYTASNSTATDTFTAASGCDSVIHLNLTILQASTGVDVVSACDTYTWIDGNTYTSSNNTATHTLTASNGCDSVVTLDLTILNSSASTDTVVTCESYTWIDGNTYTSSNNTATHTLQNAQGCDSVVSLNLTINNPVHQWQYITACDSYTWVDGMTYTTNISNATDTFTRANGCDSILHLNLTIKSSSSSTDEITACDRYTWIDGNTYTESTNLPMVTLLNSQGCDSTITLDLTIHHSTEMIDTIESCESYTWINGKTYTATNNTATHTIFNSKGCDSVIRLNLTIHEAKSTLFDTLIFEGDTVWVGSSIYTEEGIYEDLFTTSKGCDSVVTTVIYTEINGLSETQALKVRIYPNPTRAMFRIEGELQSSNGQIRVLNSFGQPVNVVQFNSRKVNHEVNLSSQPNGVYFVELRDEENVSISRVVKVD